MAFISDSPSDIPSPHKVPSNVKERVSPVGDSLKVLNEQESVLERNVDALLSALIPVITEGKMSPGGTEPSNNPSPAQSDLTRAILATAHRISMVNAQLEALIKNIEL